MSFNINEINEKLETLYIKEDNLQKKMIELDVNGKEYKSVEYECNTVSEMIDDYLSELWHLKNPPKNIDDVLRITYDVIKKILPILLQIFDSIRRRQSDASVSPELEEYISGLQQFGHHPVEWSKLVEMLQLPKKVPDSDEEEEVSDSDSDKVYEAWEYKISWLHVIFFQDKIHSDYLSDFGLLMALALTNCDEYKSILNYEKEDDLMIRDFFSQCGQLNMISLLEKYPILFFNALDHPTIRNHFLENPELETLHVHLWNICSFFVSFHSGRDFSIIELNRIIDHFWKVCDILEV